MIELGLFNNFVFIKPGLTDYSKIDGMEFFVIIYTC